MNILVVGTGSFGRFRAAAFEKRGHAVEFISRAPLPASPRFAGGGAWEWADAVFVATPPACHTDGVLLAARAGKPVLVEKPVEATLARARALEASLGDRAGLVTVAENYRFLPQIPLVAEALPTIGPLRGARVVLLRPRAPTGWRVDGKLSGGGVLADMGVHYVHLLRRFLGELVVEKAEEKARVPGTDVDAAFALSGRSTEGVPWSMELSWCSFRRASSVTLEGTEGTLRFRVGKRGLWRVGWLGLPFARQRVAGDEYGQEALHDAWLGAVARREPSPIPLLEGIRDLENIDRAYVLARATPRS